MSCWARPLLTLGRPAEAQAELTRALERAPNRARALEDLARAAEEAGDRAAADAARSTLQQIQRARSN